MGVLLSAGPLFSQARPMTDPAIKDGTFAWFDLTESRQQVASALGAPALVADAAQDLVSWQYQIAVADHDDFSHVLVFRKAGNTLISVTRNYDPERTVDELFPEVETKTYFYPDAKQPTFRLRMRRLPQGRMLLAMGVDAPRQTTGTLVLIQEAELRAIVPWLYTQLQEKK